VPATALTVAVLCFVGYRLLGAARFAFAGEGRARIRLIVRGIRWRHIWPVPFVLTLVLVVAILLVQLPVLSFGWWTAIGGTGNPVTGSTSQTDGTALAWIIPLVFLALLLPGIPLFALREEELFREGCERWSWPRRVLKAVEFGLVHTIIGIPIGVALALSIGGGYFQWVYLRGFRRSHDPLVSTLESARAHTVYNGVIVVLVAVSVVLIATGV
jgi:hypothetical protein